MISIILCFVACFLSLVFSIKISQKSDLNVRAMLFWAFSALIFGLGLIAGQGV
jgi:NO-binding membrane sensor protein with MHYT domain